MRKSVVIMFHSTNSSIWLDGVLKYLKENYTVVSIKELYDSFQQPNKRGLCYLTVDDGHKSFYRVFYPLIKKYNMPATLFVSPSVIRNNTNYWFQDVDDLPDSLLEDVLMEMFCISKQVFKKHHAKKVIKLLRISEIKEIIHRCREKVSKPMISHNVNLDQLFEMKSSGLVNIGAHTQNHPILANESYVDAEWEISSSIRELSEILNEHIHFFAYPNGTPELDFGEREKMILRENRIKLAFSTKISHLSTNDDPMELPRIGLTYGNQLFIRTKLRAGAAWGRVKNIRAKAAKKDRTRLIAEFRKNSIR